MKNKEKKEITCPPRITEGPNKESRICYFLLYWICFHWKGTLIAETLFTLVAGCFLEIIPAGKEIVDGIRGYGYAIFILYPLAVFSFFLRRLAISRGERKLNGFYPNDFYLIAVAFQIVFLLVAIYFLIFK